MDFEIVEIYLNCWGPPVILFSFSPFLSLTGEPTARMVPLVGLTAPSFSLPRTGPLSLLRSPTRDVCAACPAPPLPGRCYPEPRPTMPGLKAFAPPWSSSCTGVEHHYLYAIVPPPSPCSPRCPSVPATSHHPSPPASHRAMPLTISAAQPQRHSLSSVPMARRSPSTTAEPSPLSSLHHRCLNDGLIHLTEFFRVARTIIPVDIDSLELVRPPDLLEWSHRNSILC
jgi:hypothetical protein